MVRSTAPLSMNVDHRFTQTQKRYAADDLETISEAVRYQQHIYDVLRPFISANTSSKSGAASAR